MEIYKLEGFDVWWTNTFYSTLPIWHVEQIAQEEDGRWIKLDENRFNRTDVNRMTCWATDNDLPMYVKCQDAGTNYYYYLSDFKKIKAVNKEGNLIYEGTYVLDEYMTMFHNKLHILMDHNVSMRFKSKFCNRWEYNPSTNRYYINYVKQKWMGQYASEESLQLIREECYSVTAKQLYEQNFGTPPTVPISFKQYNGSATISYVWSKFTEPLHDLNRYRYMVCKSSAKVTTSNSYQKPMETTQTIIIIPFFEGDNTSHAINDIDISSSQSGALAPVGENSIGVFDCDLPYSIFYGMSTTDPNYVKLKYATNKLTDGSSANIPFFEVSMNFAKRLKVVDYLGYENGFYGKLKNMIDNFDKLRPDTEPYMMQPAWYQEIYNNGNGLNVINNNGAYFGLTWTPSGGADELGLYAYMLFNDNLYFAYDYGNETNTQLTSWDNTETNVAEVGLQVGMLSSSSANYYVNNVNTGLTNAANRQSEELQAWLDYGLGSAATIAKQVGWSTIFNPGKAAAAAINVIQSGIDTAMSQDRANKTYYSQLNNIYSSPSTTTNPVVKSSVPQKKDRLFRTMQIKLHPEDEKRLFMQYLHNGYPFTFVRGINEFKNRQYMNVLNVDAQFNYTLAMKVLKEFDTSIFVAQADFDAFFNWLNLKHEMFETNYFVNVYDYTASDYVDNIEIDPLPIIKTDINHISWVTRTSYPEDYNEQMFKQDNTDVFVDWNRVNITIMKTDNIYISVAAKPNDDKYYGMWEFYGVFDDVNIMVVNNISYILDNNLDHNLFCGYQSTLAGPFPLKNGGQLTNLTKSSITSLILNSLASSTSINYAFLYGCSSLTSLTLPDTWNITSIGDDFLVNCSGLTSLILPSSWNITSIGDYFLYGCSSLTSLTLPDTWNITSIGSYFLVKSSSLTSLTLPDTWNITSIGGYFLYNCRNLTSVNMGNINASIMISNEYSFSTFDSSAKCYTTGITIIGNDKTNILKRFPNQDTAPYRKLK